MAKRRKNPCSGGSNSKPAAAYLEESPNPSIDAKLRGKAKKLTDDGALPAHIASNLKKSKDTVEVSSKDAVKSSPILRKTARVVPKLATDPSSSKSPRRSLKSPPPLYP